ncbi:MAG: FapA family protein [Treponema sp.]|jgi:uncharacterized protein (DUF342 family)|nr:FapA family protein [Treponema sp.]
MVNLVQLQQILKEQLEIDRTIHAVETSGPTLEEALSAAAIQLNLPIRRLEYEIAEKGSAGFLGSGKRDWKIRAYERMSFKQEEDSDLDWEEEETAAPVIEDRAGDAFVRLSADGAYLKVVLPRGKGKRVTEAQARMLLASRKVTDINDVLVAKTVRDAGGVYVRIGDFEHKAINDSMAAVDILDQGMKAVLTLTPPGPGGCDISYENLLSFLQNNRVVHGIKKEFLQDFADRPVYKQAVVIAEGTNPVNGRDAHIQYNFEIDQTKVHLREGFNGKIDFKDLNIIQNVVENQPLAKKIPAERGSPGSTVTARTIPPKNGKDIELPLGKNVHVGNDGVTIIADMNGQVVLTPGKINVEPIYTVQGGVNLKTGNIIFLGTVIINGNVEDGFSVKAAGNIEVNGTVEKAELDAEGDVVVHQGITGKGGGIVRAGRSIWARFIENSMIEAGNMVVASDGIINSQVDAYKRIVCQGKHAHIVGGRLRASEEINAKIIGSPTGGTETVCEVGIDPKNKERFDELTENKITIERELEEIQRNLQTLLNIKKQRQSLPEDKEAYMNELTEKRRKLTEDLKKNEEDLYNVQQYLNDLTVRGRVSASYKVYPGVKIFIRDFREDVRDEFRSVTFILEDDLVKVIDYEEPDKEIMRGPDGYTTD